MSADRAGRRGIILCPKALIAEKKVPSEPVKGYEAPPVAITTIFDLYSALVVVTIK